MLDLKDGDQNLILIRGHRPKLAKE
jgi:hypothetical protein